MTINLRNYTTHPGISEDYFRVRDFFVKLGYSEFVYARWDWMATHSWLDKTAVGKIGLWEDDGTIIGIATFDTQLGSAYCLTAPDFRSLKKEMLEYSAVHLAKDGKFGVVIPDTDLAFQELAAKAGYVASQDKEEDAVFYLEKTSTAYQLPEGFSVTSMKEHFDLRQYRRVLWKGFNHELNGEGAFTFSEDDEASAREEMLRPFVDLDLKIAVISPEGNFASYCGMWYEPKTGFALIEPVATDPDYRKLGLGKAAVLEGIRRVGRLGAKFAFVGSSQQFYYNIGMRHYTTSTVWVKPEI